MAELRSLSPTKLNESPTRAKKKWALQKAEQSYFSFRGAADAQGNMSSGKAF